MERPAATMSADGGGKVVGTGNPPVSCSILDSLSVTQYTKSAMSEWYSIEVFDGASSAGLWAEAHGDPILESALLAGAKDWSWQHHSWGVVLEVEFADAKGWDAWRALPHVQAALDAVPDPISGLDRLPRAGWQRRTSRRTPATPHGGRRLGRIAAALGVGDRRSCPAAAVGVPELRATPAGQRRL